jgi:amino acid transporter
LRKTLRFISKVIIGIIIWLIFTDLQRTYFGGHYISNTIFTIFGICLLLLIISKIVWLIKKKKILNFATFGTVYLLSLLIGMILVNITFKNIAEFQFVRLLKDIDKYKIENGHLPEKLKDLSSNHFNIYGIIPHEFIYEGYKPFIWNGIGFDESEIDSKTEKIIGYKSPFGYSKYRIAEDEDFEKIIEEVSRINVW